MRYLLIHTPVHLARPVQLGLVEASAWSEALFQKYAAQVEANRQAGAGSAYLSKRDIERWGFWPPCGARVQVLELYLGPPQSVPIAGSQTAPQLR